MKLINTQWNALAHSGETGSEAGKWRATVSEAHLFKPDGFPYLYYFVRPVSSFVLMTTMMQHCAHLFGLSLSLPLSWNLIYIYISNHSEAMLITNMFIWWPMLFYTVQLCVICGLKRIFFAKLIFNTLRIALWFGLLLNYLLNKMNMFLRTLCCMRNVQWYLVSVGPWFLIRILSVEFGMFV